MRFKHRLSITVFLVIAALTVSSGVYADNFVTGKDWTQRMSKREKFLAVFAPFILYHRYGVPFRKLPQEYISDIDKILVVNPYLEAEEVAHIFASTVYTFEPESRPAFRAMVHEFQYQNLDQAEAVYPRLLLASPITESQDTPAE